MPRPRAGLRPVSRFCRALRSRRRPLHIRDTGAQSGGSNRLRVIALTRAFGNSLDATATGANYLVDSLPSL